ncbi:MAG: type III pantothenate kinase [Clostridia bacterium]|nr:type III pantothenate kinase [Clostridia bacterium]
MLLTVDIGNTNILFGLFHKEKIVLEARLASDTKRTKEQYALDIKGICNLKNISLDDVDGAIISSVVPELTNSIKDAIQILTPVSPLVVGPGVKSGLHIKIDNPVQLGADLVAGAVGAIEKFPLPCLVMDLGTATKISVIDKNGAFLGCTISAGVGISLKALSGSAALLPTVNLNLQECPAFGTNTVASMQAGIILGTAAMLDGLCERIEESLGYSVASIVSTGGLAQNITKHCKREVTYEPDLILYGLKAIYYKN